METEYWNDPRSRGLQRKGAARWLQQTASANQSESSGVPEPKAPTLLEEALAAYRTKPLQKGGDTIVTLDGMDLARSCRLSSENIIEAVPVLECQLLHPKSSRLGVDVDGIKHLLVLEKAVNGMPRLSQLSLNTMRKDCEDVLHTKASGEGAGAQVRATETSTKSEKVTQVKRKLRADRHDSAIPDTKSSRPQLEAHLSIGLPATSPFYESYPTSDRSTMVFPRATLIQLLRRSKPWPKLPVRTRPLILSVVEDRIGSFLLREFSLSRANRLWTSVAKDAARWLVVAVHLESSLLCKETFIHVAVCYPNLPWNVSRADMEKQVPTSITSAIATKSQALALLRASMERKLLCCSSTLPIMKTRQSQPASDQTMAPASGWPSAASTSGLLHICGLWMVGHRPLRRSALITKASHSPPAQR